MRHFPVRCTAKRGSDCLPKDLNAKPVKQWWACWFWLLTGHEAQLAQELEQLIELDQLPDLNALTQLLAPPKGDVPQVVVTLPTLASYDDLFEVAL